MHFRDIPQFPRENCVHVIEWRNLESHIAKCDPAFNMRPVFQRGIEWSDERQIAFVEYGLMGGESSMVITTNCPGWMADFRGPYELIDGLQRLTAVLRFLRNEIPAFGTLYRDFEGRMSSNIAFQWRILTIKSEVEVLDLYLAMNTGGMAHSPEEIARVKALRAKKSRG